MEKVCDAPNNISNANIIQTLNTLVKQVEKKQDEFTNSIQQLTYSRQYIYLIRTREFIRTGESVYKIGKTTQKPNKRMNGYAKNSEVLLYITVDDCHKTEDKIKAMFDKKYTQRADIGREYYEGSEKAMIKDIYQITEPIILLKDELPAVQNPNNISPIINITNVTNNYCSDSDIYNDDDDDDDIFIQYLENANLDWFVSGNVIDYNILYEEYKNIGNISKRKFNKIYKDILFSNDIRTRSNGLHIRKITLI